MAIPKPGKPVRGSASGAPVMAIFDLLGRRWAMGIVWQLSEGPVGFNELQSRCNSISPTLLSARLKDLAEARLLERSLEGYQLTKIGRDLFAVLLPFGEWSLKWSKAMKP